ncbi:hypothetical protein [Mycobacterium uberis]|uniref:hypothetical protein n=1 Tax=Mycobacterium uberis TaxID=2162698 RepID=UPI001FB38B97|nr:hypothetical protein [Mycobacterium uberis]
MGVVVIHHSVVLEAAAIGVPSQLGEDNILLTVTLRPGAALYCAELLDFYASRMLYASACYGSSRRLTSFRRMLL